MQLVSTLGLFLTLLHLSTSLLLGAFNIRSFGDTKASNTTLMNIISTVWNILSVKSFTLIPQHTSPDFAVQELNALYDVVADVRNRWKTNDIVLLGDFNAGCNYVSGSDWQQISIFTDKSFHWLITDEADTTVTHTNCPYDRIVVTTDMMNGVVKGSAEVYNYTTELNLKQDLALAVSDHFPVEVKLIGQPPAA
ncbi:deoxyribonuclease-1-like [Archocentrus centrarchus]|uniref:deoxyribonuclease-1-like n=1 Tax=Archocentrus centrarchus TaxID=63155 RepID=UPI0011EA469D|nr:deoxyribonuclease-1-like [Archocentrus centrarchus]